MKQTVFTLLIISTFGFMSCRKDQLQQTIKQYDSVQIKNYMLANNLTGFLKDTAGGDTSGIYYKIINKGTGSAFQYSTLIPLVYSFQTLDGTYTNADTIKNHLYDYLGHIQNDGLTLGLQTALINDLKFSGGTIRILIPSRLAYGHSGSGSGSSTVTNNRIAGNESLDFYVSVPKVEATPYDPINNISTLTTATYDDLSIQKYMADSTTLSGYTKVESVIDLPGAPKNYYYYKVVSPGSGTYYLTDRSSITVNYTGMLLNGTVFDSYTPTGGTPFYIGNLTQGVKEALELTDNNGNSIVKLNTKISILVPSNLAYKFAGTTGIPAFSCLRFDFYVDAITQ
jgi:FKBP-type peptidyl-prolyl cis-trans isomerase